MIIADVVCTLLCYLAGYAMFRSFSHVWMCFFGQDAEETSTEVTLFRFGFFVGRTTLTLGVVFGILWTRQKPTWPEWFTSVVLDQAAIWTLFGLFCCFLCGGCLNAIKTRELVEKLYEADKNDHDRGEVPATGSIKGKTNDS